MKILFLTDNFPPEFNAPASRTFAHCREWAKHGELITVITCAPNFPRGKVFKGYRNRLWQVEMMDGIKVIRVWTYISANKGFVKRILDYMSFMAASFFAGLFVKADLIIATSPQFFTAISGRWLSFWKRKKWVLEVRDLWPESIKAVGAMRTNLVFRFFEYLEKKMYKNAHKIVVVTDSFRHQLLVKHGVDDEKIEVVKNGIDAEMFAPQKKDTSLLESLGLENKYVIGYIGTHGMAHALDFILKSAADLTDLKLHFLFLGTGAEKENLIGLKQELRLKNVTMLDSVPKDEVSRYISILDCGLVNLKKSETFKSVIPSKIFELAAMHKPILLGVEGESKKMVESYHIGISFEPENRKDFIDKTYQISQMVFKDSDFESFVKEFDRKHLASKMLRFIKA